MTEKVLQVFTFLGKYVKIYFDNIDGTVGYPF